MRFEALISKLLVRGQLAYHQSAVRLERSQEGCQVWLLPRGNILQYDVFVCVQHPNEHMSMPIPPAGRQATEARKVVGAAECLWWH